MGSDVDVLHTNVPNSARKEALGGRSLASVLCAPGHSTLRNPEAVPVLADLAAKTGTLPAGEPVVINVATCVEDEHVRVKALHCCDGNHRVAAAIFAGMETLSDLASA